MQDVPTGDRRMSRTGERTAYIHIGPPKTGSSSIKHYFRHNRKTLLDNGLFIPQLLNERGVPARNHMQLVKSDKLTRSGDIKDTKPTGWKEIDPIVQSRSHNVLLSSEMFTMLFEKREKLNRVVDYFDSHGYSVRVIAYVRDQPAWLNSWYVQSQKRMLRHQTFDSFIEEIFENGKGAPIEYLAPYIEHSKIELDAAPFEKVCKTGLERDFITRCGIPESVSLECPDIRNTNAGIKSIYASQQIMKAIGPDLHRIEGYGHAYHQFRRKVKKLHWDALPYVALTPELYRRIRDHYAETNEVFARVYFGASWNELYPERVVAPSVFDPGKATKAELDEIQSVVVEIVQHLKRLQKKEAKRAKAA
jgi:hypothetical protein